MEENERIFTELLLSIERKYNEVKEMIRSHEKSTVTRGEILLDRIEEEVTLLRKRHNDLEKLSHTDDHIHFLQVSVRQDILLYIFGHTVETDLCAELAVSVGSVWVRGPQQYQCHSILLL